MRSAKHQGKSEANRATTKILSNALKKWRGANYPTGSGLWQPVGFRRSSRPRPGHRPRGHQARQHYRSGHGRGSTTLHFRFTPRLRASRMLVRINIHRGLKDVTTPVEVDGAACLAPPVSPARKSSTLTRPCWFTITLDQPQITMDEPRPVRPRQSVCDLHGRSSTPRLAASPSAGLAGRAGLPATCSTTVKPCRRPK